MKQSVYIFIILICNLPSDVWASPCNIVKDKKVIFENKLGRTVEWTINPSDEVYSPAVLKEPIYTNYVNWVRSNTTKSAHELISHFLNVISKAAEDLRNNDQFLESLNQSIYNVTLVLEGHVGQIYPINCLESLPFLEFLEIVDLRKKPSEFYVTVLKKNNELKIIGDFYKSEIDDIGTSESEVAKTQRYNLIKQAWAFEAIYHNHPFNFDKKYDDLGGVIVPSNPDLRLYLEQAPRTAIISNGIESFAVEQKDFKKFKL
jgi:hypothetical protein